MKNSSYKNITDRLQNASKHYLLVGFAEAFLAACAACIWLTVCFTLFEYFRYLSPQIKKSIFFSISAAFVAIFLINAFFRYMNRPGLDGMARMVEKAYPNLKNFLVSAVQLGRLEEAELQGQSQPLIGALVHKVDEDTKAVDMASSVSTRRLFRWLRIVYGSVLIVLLMTFIFPQQLFSGFFRLADYTHKYFPPGGIMIYSPGGDSSIIRGDNFSAAGFVSGGNGKILSILYRWDDTDVWSVKPVEFDSGSGEFSVKLEKPRTSFHYFLEMDTYSTTNHRITVIERPVVEKLVLTVTYPGYTGLGTVVMKDNEGNIRAPDGTAVSLKVTANKLLRQMVIHWGDSTVTDCSVDGVGGTAEFNVTGDITYHIGLVDSLGISNRDPISYRVTCMKDENPAIAILSPASDIVLPRSLRFPVVYRARDDFGLFSVTLNYKLPYEATARELHLKKGELGKNILDEYEWDLSNTNLLPDDTVSYFLTVYDNDTVRGPKKGVSETRTARMPSLTDLLRQSLEEQDSGVEKLRAMSDRTAQQQKELAIIRRNIKSGKEMDWSEMNAIKEAAENLEVMKNELSDLSETIKKTVEQLSEEDIATLETLDKMNKIARLMDELADGKMKDALKRLAEAAAGLDPEKINKALEDYEITSDMIMEKLERFINLLEQTMTIQRFEMARKILEEIAFRQAEISEHFNQQERPSNLGREQESLSSEMHNLEEEISEVSADLNENFSLDTESLESQVSPHDISEKMSETASQIDNKSDEEAQSNLEQLDSMLSELLETMNNLDASMRSRNMAELKNRLFKAAVALLAVSQKQENMIGEIGKTDNENLAKQEIEIIDGILKARRKLIELSSIFVEITDAVDMLAESARMNAELALDSFAAGSVAAGKLEALNTLSALNKTVHFLTMLIGNSPEGGMSMPGDVMSMLQQIASGQLSLTLQLNCGTPGDMLARMAAEQNKLAEMLAGLNKKLAMDKRLREMLEKIVEDMDDTANMMRMNREREKVERKQLDIYRRLLDARRSRREKDEEKKRKSWTAKRDFSIGADELAADRGEKKRALNERIKRAGEDDFRPEYKRLILRYFESMLEDDVEVSGNE